MYLSFCPMFVNKEITTLYDIYDCLGVMHVPTYFFSHIKQILLEKNERAAPDADLQQFTESIDMCRRSDYNRLQEEESSSYHRYVLFAVSCLPAGFPSAISSAFLPSFKII